MKSVKKKISPQEPSIGSPQAPLNWTLSPKSNGKHLHIWLQGDLLDTLCRSYQAAARASKHEPVDLQAEERHRRQQQQHTVYSKDSLNQDTLFQGRSSAEREAAVNLAQFAHSDPNSQLRGGRVEELVRTLFVSILAVSHLHGFDLAYVPDLPPRLRRLSMSMASSTAIIHTARQTVTIQSALGTGTFPS